MAENGTDFGFGVRGKQHAPVGLASKGGSVRPRAGAPQEIPKPFFLGPPIFGDGRRHAKTTTLDWPVAQDSLRQPGTNCETRQVSGKSELGEKQTTVNST
jgi:hypothetical protein